MPLHIFLSTWIGSELGLLDVAKVAKDVLLVAGFVCVALISRWSDIRRLLLKSRAVQLMLAYGALTLLLALLKPTDQDAEILGVVYNTRFLLMFMYGVLLCVHYKPSWLLRRAFQVVAGVGGVVLLFGFLQYTLLPDDALTHFGYSRENGVLPGFLIDDKPGLERIMSTLRDPNAYGSYLIILNTLFAVFWFRAKNSSQKKLFGGLMLLGLLNLLFTFSRSAWIGMSLSLVVVGAFLYARWPKKQKQTILGLVTVLIIGLIPAIYLLRDQHFVQNIVFHADESTVLEDPNQLRTRFFRESVERTIQNPLGHGPGTAGLASIKNDEQVVLNENYYLQIAHEVGIFGLALFIAIVISVGFGLYKRRSNVYAQILFASLIGLSFTNLLVHIWSNEAVAYVWWGLAGLAIGFNTTYKQNDADILGSTEE